MRVKEEEKIRRDIELGKERIETIISHFTLRHAEFVT
jgi:hypothetical protein